VPWTWAAIAAATTLANAPEAQVEAGGVHQKIERPEALANFLDRLGEVEDGKCEPIVRVVNLGASTIGFDDLTGVLREKFQRRFGDGGAGFVLMQRYLLNYTHNWVELHAKGWKSGYILWGGRKDGRYGLGGVSYDSDGGAVTRMLTREHEFGDEVSKIEVWYSTMPKKGGQLLVEIDDEAPRVVDTVADVHEDRWAVFDVPKGPHQVRVKAKGKVRTYGLVFETAGPGVVWDQMSMIAVATQHMLRWNDEHIAGQVAHRKPDLLVFAYGGNDLQRVADGKLPQDQYVREYTALVNKVRAGKPDASCMILGITERKQSKGRPLDTKDMTTIVDGQRATAEATGCAFFDMYTAMGGKGSFRRWQRHKPPLVKDDQIHLSHEGNEKMGAWIFESLMSEYESRRAAKTKPKKKG
jgi:lysophospholipase L1-like esterase